MYALAWAEYRDFCRTRMKVIRPKLSLWTCGHEVYHLCGGALKCFTAIVSPPNTAEVARRGGELTDGDPLGVQGAQVGVLHQVHQKILGGLHRLDSAGTYTAAAAAMCSHILLLLQPHLLPANALQKQP